MVSNKYVIEYRDRDGEVVDSWSYPTAEQAERGLADIAARNIILYDDDPDRASYQPLFIEGSLVWRQES